MSEDQLTNTPGKSAFGRFWQELRRRNVFRVASVYLITGWIVIQVASVTFGSFGIPEWAFRFVTLMVLLGLPVALIIAWAFELTPEGIKVSQSATAEVSPSTDPAASKAATQKRNWLSYGFAAALPTLIFGALALFFYIQLGSSGAGLDAAKASANASDKLVAKSIAVMPLVNMSSHEENIYFAGGIHEDVLTNLSRIKNLQVKSRTAMLKYAATDLTLSEIGKELNLDYIVEGSVRRIGNHVRVTVQLIDANNENHLWANNFERELIDSFATQSELAKEISNSLHLEIQPESVEKLEGMPTTSVKAYDLYIRAAGLEKTEGRTEKSMKRRSEMLEAAVIEDPGFVEAWAVLKRLYDNQLNRARGAGWYVIGEGRNLEDVVKELSEKSRRALEKAVALDPDNVETLLSGVVDYQWPKSLEEMQEHKAVFDHLVTTYPEHAKSWYHLGWWYSKLGDMPDQDSETAKASAAEAFETSLRLDPFNARMVQAVLGWYRNSESQQDVTRLVERLTQIIPDTANDRALARVSLQVRQGRVKEAFLATADEDYIEELEKIVQQRLSTGDYIYPISSVRDETEVQIFSNMQDKLLERASKPITEKNPLAYTWIFSHVKKVALAVNKNRGQLKEARVIAREILAEVERDQNQHFDALGIIRSAQVTAYSVLGEHDKALQIAEAMLVDVEFQTDESLAQRITWMSFIDPERAVELAFAEQAKRPNWTGFDGLAAFHLFSYPLLVHPKVQQYYLKEGKWIDYLAERVPEYAKYRKL